VNPSTRGPVRHLVREDDGSLRDAGTRVVVTTEDLVDGLRSGRRFRVRGRGDGADRTAEVLAEVLGAILFGARERRRGGLLEPFLASVRAAPPGGGQR